MAVIGLWNVLHVSEVGREGVWSEMSEMAVWELSEAFQ